jgi:hypothetical protein
MSDKTKFWILLVLLLASIALLVRLQSGATAPFLFE